MKSPRPLTWPWIAALIALLAGLALLPPVQDAGYAVDSVVARHLNSYLGRNATFDRALAAINTRAGDVVTLFGMMLVGLVHCARAPHRRGQIERASYWAFIAATFLVVYEINQPIEQAAHRDSPAKIFLPNWVDINNMYDIDVKVWTSRSYPSGHGSLWFFIALMLVRMYRRVGLLFLAGAIIMPMTRVAIGSHWTSDIMLGSLPMMALASAIALETPVFRLRRWLEILLRRVLCWARWRQRALGLRFSRRRMPPLR